MHQVKPYSTACYPRSNIYQACLPHMSCEKWRHATSSCGLRGELQATTWLAQLRNASRRSKKHLRAEACAPVTASGRGVGGICALFEAAVLTTDTVHTHPPTHVRQTHPREPNKRASNWATCCWRSGKRGTSNTQGTSRKCLQASEADTVLADSQPSSRKIAEQNGLFV